MAKKAETQLTEEQLKDKPAKQSFVKITKNKNKNPRTWVVIYRLVDGPPVDPEKSRKRKAAQKKKKAACLSGLPTTPGHDYGRACPSDRVNSDG